MKNKRILLVGILLLILLSILAFFLIAKMNNSVATTLVPTPQEQIDSIIDFYSNKYPDRGYSNLSWDQLRTSLKANVSVINPYFLKFPERFIRAGMNSCQEVDFNSKIAGHPNERAILNLESKTVTEKEYDSVDEAVKNYPYLGQFIFGSSGEPYCPGILYTNFELKYSCDYNDPSGLIICSYSLINKESDDDNLAYGRGNRLFIQKTSTGKYFVVGSFGTVSGG
jgi:hypothetical protein